MNLIAGSESFEEWFLMDLWVKSGHNRQQSLLNIILKWKYFDDL